MPKKRTTPTPGETIAKMRLEIQALRKRLYPILIEWWRHGLTRQDNYYGFMLMTALEYRLDQLEEQLGIDHWQTAPPRRKQRRSRDASTATSDTQ